MSEGDRPGEVNARALGLPTFCPRCKARSGFGFAALVCPYCEWKFGTKPQLVSKSDE